MQEKEGLQTAIDFTKYLLTLAGGAIAFAIQPDFSKGHWWLKAVSIAALVLLTVSVISGLVVFARGCVMLAAKNYQLSDGRIRFFGLVNVLSFAASFILLAIAVGIKVVQA